MKTGRWTWLAERAPESRIIKVKPERLYILFTFWPCESMRTLHSVECKLLSLVCQDLCCRLPNLWKPWCTSSRCLGEINEILLELKSFAQSWLNPGETTFSLFDSNASSVYLMLCDGLNHPCGQQQSHLFPSQTHPLWKLVLTKNIELTIEDSGEARSTSSSTWRLGLPHILIPAPNI